MNVNISKCEEGTNIFFVSNGDMVGGSSFWLQESSIPPQPFQIFKSEENMLASLNASLKLRPTDPVT